MVEVNQEHKEQRLNPDKEPHPKRADDLIEQNNLEQRNVPEQGNMPGQDNFAKQGDLSIRGNLLDQSNSPRPELTNRASAGRGFST